MPTSHNEFTKYSLLLENLENTPRLQFSKWLDEYIQLNISDSVSMVLSTIDRNAYPSSRVVYMRDCDAKGFVFFTNYDSNKGEELRMNKKASLLFHWPELERQVRVWGMIEKIETDLSDAYFSERPKTSQAGAWVSRQSKVIKDRVKLEQMHQAFLRNTSDKIIPRPKFWGGYRLIPNKFEFWQGRESRLHDRFLYELKADNWDIKRLAP